MRTRSVLKYLLLLALCFHFLFLTSSWTSAPAQSRSEKNSARRLMEEMSESDDDEPVPPSTSKKSTPKKSKSKKNTSKNGNQKSSKSKLQKKSTKDKKGKKNVQVVEDTRSPEEKERERLAYFHKTGVWRWPELTDEQFTMTIQRQKEYLERVKAQFPGTIYYESPHFFYLTDAPRQIAEESLKYLEAMHSKLCEVFEFPKDAKVWDGKCLVCAFVTEQRFLQFEQAFFSSTASQFVGANGLAHTSSDGQVLISLYYGDISKMEKRWQFIGVLVHETTHGFVHRYRARQEIPLWLNEGMAEFMAGIIVPADQQVVLKQRHGLEQMRLTGSVGGLLQAQQQIDVWQYGVASGLVGFLIRNKPHAFKQFLDEIKDGKDWNDALMDQYQCTAEGLLMSFGRANRIPGLTF